MDFFKVPNSLTEINGISTADLASGMYERIQSQIKDLEEKLNPDEHILATIDNIAISEIGYYNPHLLIFYGINSQGNQVQKLIHINSLNMDLTVLETHNSDKKKKSIGFLGEID